MGCCGQVSKPKKQNVVPATVVIQPENSVQQPVVSNVVNDNINSQRAAAVSRQQYHKRRFGNFG